MLGHDREAAAWWIVPAEIKSWLTEKARTCDAGLPALSLLTLPTVSWGVYAEERDASTTFRWTSDEAVILARNDIHSISLAVRRPGATMSQPVRATIFANGKTTTVTLDSDEWQYVTIHFQPSVLAWLRQAQRLDINVPSWFVPAASDPKSSDLRRLGVEFRIVDEPARGSVG